MLTSLPKLLPSIYSLVRTAPFFGAKSVKTALPEMPLSGSSLAPSFSLQELKRRPKIKAKLRCIKCFLYFFIIHSVKFCRFSNYVKYAFDFLEIRVCGQRELRVIVNLVYKLVYLILLISGNAQYQSIQSFVDLSQIARAGNLLGYWYMHFLQLFFNFSLCTGV